jgi:hypothetical protein
MTILTKSLSASVIALAVSGAAWAETPSLQSAGALAFDNANTLFIGDSKAGVVHAFDLGDDILEDQSDYVLGRAQTFEGRTIIDKIDVEIAALLGITANEVVINDMAVHAPTKQIFLSVHRGRGPDAEAVIFKVDHGKVELVGLDAASHSQTNVGPVPSAQALEFGQLLNTLAITDIDFYQGEIFVSGVSNQEFSSTLRRIAYPFNGDVKSTSIEIWHAVHAQYETRAPIITQTIVELDGEPTLVAVYACTPIVKIPLTDLTDGAHIRGTMIGEMGFGNTPIDILPYANPWDGSMNVVITNTNRSAASINLEAIADANAMPHGEGVGNVFAIAGVPQFPMPMSGTQHLDIIDPMWAVALRADPENGRNVQLHTLSLPFFFDRADHIVEMNFESFTADPFGYKSAPPLEYN